MWYNTLCLKWKATDMKTTFSILCCAVAAAAFALPPVRPVLPPVAHDDTETVTNVPFAPMSATATVDGAAAFAGIDASELYRRSWNMMRLTGRGLDDSSESPEVRVLPDSLSVFLR